MTYSSFYRIVILFSFIFTFYACSSDVGEREVISLNGTWQIAQTKNDMPPETYLHTVPVPGLVDMATPKFDSVGMPATLRNYFWYKKEVDLAYTKDEAIRLKFLKAKYGIQVWLNKKRVGEHLYNFSSKTFDITEYLNPSGSSNELVVRTFAHPEQLPDSIVWGHDFEKIKYIPGLYDDVRILKSVPPLIKNVQIAPNITEKKAEVVVWLDRKGFEGPFELQYQVFDDFNPDGLSEKVLQVPSGQDSLRFDVPMEHAKLWSPKTPHLYTLQLNTPGDSYESRFGMRDFRFNPESNLAELNGQPMYLRGTNICIHRFFEDKARKSLPWDPAWVRKLIKRIKSMHWEHARFCLGFPPEFWYDIADEEGLIIQDEYPIWYGPGTRVKFPTAFTAERLAKEYTSWMQDRWNHASVVTWDAQNESVTEATGAAIEMVRNLDLSNRPWDNGYSPPQRSTDPIESHPYVLQNYLGQKPDGQGPLYPFFKEIRIPDNDPNDRFPRKDSLRYPNPILSNEYAFFLDQPRWLPDRSDQEHLRKSVRYHTVERRFKTDLCQNVRSYYAVLAGKQNKCGSDALLRPGVF